MQQEIWKDVPGYVGFYKVSNLGRVKGKRGIIKPILTRGYLTVLLCKNSNQHKHHFVHRLVGLTFIANPENKPEIDHKDGNALNNNVDNLRWVTRQENELNPITRQRISESKQNKRNGMYGKRNEEIHNSRKIACFDLDGTFIKEYPSIFEATRQTGVSSSAIGNCASGRKKFDKRNGNFYVTKSAGGFIWRYV